MARYKEWSFVSCHSFLFRPHHLSARTGVAERVRGGGLSLGRSCQFLASTRCTAEGLRG